MASKIYTLEQFITAVKNSHSYSEVCRLIGISPKGGNLKTVKNKILELNLDMSHFTGARWNRGETSETHPSIKKKDISEILVENSGWSSGNLRKRLIKEGLKEAKCECCGKTDWLGVPIPLELHHINGIHTDNRLLNLLVLCPNCHAMTDNHLDIKKLSVLIKNQLIEGSKILESLLTRHNKMVADKTSVIFKEINNMEIKNNQLTIDIPKGMEIDLENSDLAKGIVKFKKKDITYEDILQSYTTEYGSLVVSSRNINKLLAISKLMDIAKYYNGDWKPDWNNLNDCKYHIICNNGAYAVDYSYIYIYSSIYFKNKEDAIAVINNPNFRDILDAIYKN